MIWPICIWFIEIGVTQLNKFLLCKQREEIFIFSSNCVSPINISSLIWTSGDSCIPVDYAVYEKDKETHNDHFQRLLKKAKGVRNSL